MKPMMKIKKLLVYTLKINIYEVKKAFNLKTFLHKVSESFKNKKDIENNDDKSAA